MPDISYIPNARYRHLVLAIKNLEPHELDAEYIANLFEVMGVFPESAGDLQPFFKRANTKETSFAGIKIDDSCGEDNEDQAFSGDDTVIEQFCNELRELNRKVTLEDEEIRRALEEMNANSEPDPEMDGILKELSGPGFIRSQRPRRIVFRRILRMAIESKAELSAMERRVSTRDERTFWQHLWGEVTFIDIIEECGQVLRELESQGHTLAASKLQRTFKGFFEVPQRVRELSEAERVREISVPMYYDVDDVTG